jgi:3-oxoacyl-[acyl-carrier protein] reductase
MAEDRSKVDPGELSGQVAVVTGAGQGIGKAYAEALASRGALVVLVDINGDSVASVTDQLQDAGAAAIGVRADIATLDGCSEVARRALNEFGSADILVNNAAIYDGLRLTSLEDISVDEWDRVMAVNVKGPWLMTQAVVPTMKARGFGRIVNIASTVVQAGPARLLHYVASKGAVVSMTRAMARELGPFGIRVNAVSPGLTFTSATRGMLTADAADAAVQRQILHQPLEPEDVVPLVMFLCSSTADLITGQNYVVDGGSVLN